jgi:hypothetical protein
MDANEIADALVEWALETCPDLNGSYDHDPDSKTQPLPDVAAVVGGEGDSQSDPTLGLEIADFGLQETTLHTTRASLVLMVDPGDGAEATEQLQGFVSALAATLRADRTLGGRVRAASPFWQASYEPPFVEFDDGTKGRVATFSLAVAELI